MQLASADRLALEELYSKYCYFIDANDPEGWVSTWTPDGVFSRPAAGVNVGAAEDRKGHEELKRQLLHWSDDQPASTDRPRHQHWVNNIWFENITQTSATGHASLMVVESGNEVARVITMGTYTDDLVKIDERWLFKKRTATLWF
jgi:hypothetical protein